MTETKFCKDCKFLESQKQQLYDNAFNKCYHPSAIIEPDDTAKTIYLVNGIRPREKYYYAAINRGVSGGCGKDATFFEPKEAASEKNKPKFSDKIKISYGILKTFLGLKDFYNE